MVTYLALCARSRLRVLACEDDAHGVLGEDGRGGGRFEWVELRPRVTVSDASEIERATRLHDKAHELCFIASSCNFPVPHRAEVRA
jgi:organic hydroperoxide reductase OsmC/OhrA